MLLMSDEKDILDEYFERLCEEIPEEVSKAIPFGAGIKLPR